MTNKTWFPAWLPYPKSWMMAIKLAIPAYGGATVAIACEFWRYSIIGSLLAITGNMDLIFFFIASAIALLLALLWFLILTKIYTFLLKLMWSNPPQSICVPKFKTLIFRDFGILVLSILPIATIFASYILFFTSYKQTLADLRTPRLTYDVFLLRFSWLWLISAAYLYQWCRKKSFGKSSC